MTTPAIRDQWRRLVHAQCPAPVAPNPLGGLTFCSSYSPSETQTRMVLNQRTVPILATLIQQAFSSPCVVQMSIRHRSDSRSTGNPVTAPLPPAGPDFPLPVTMLRACRV